jgi:hypothetical protein
LIIGRHEVDVGVRVLDECLTELDARFGVAAGHPSGASR